MRLTNRIADDLNQNPGYLLDKYTPSEMRRRESESVAMLTEKQKKRRQTVMRTPEWRRAESYEAFSNVYNGAPPLLKAETINNIQE